MTSTAMRLIVLVMVAVLLATTITQALADAPPQHNPLDFGLRILGFTKEHLAAPVQPQRELKVIGAGFYRTGTMSTKKALERLGYRVFHFVGPTRSRDPRRLPPAPPQAPPKAPAQAPTQAPAPTQAQT